MAYVELVNANGVPARIYWPSGEERAVLVWFHGGAWMFGDLDTSEAVVRLWRMQRTVPSSRLTIDWRQSMSIRRRLMTAGARQHGHLTTSIGWEWGAIVREEISLRRWLFELATRVCDLPRSF